eukprot:6195056-Pleurochrysis_carterae.AAC.1
MARQGRRKRGGGETERERPSHSQEHVHSRWAPPGGLSRQAHVVCRRCIHWRCIHRRLTHRTRSFNCKASVQAVAPRAVECDCPATAPRLRCHVETGAARCDRALTWPMNRKNSLCCSSVTSFLDLSQIASTCPTRNEEGIGGCVR